MKRRIGLRRLGHNDMLATIAPRLHRSLQRAPTLGRNVAHALHLKGTNMPAVIAAVLTTREPRRIDAPRVATIPIDKRSARYAPNLDAVTQLRRAADDWHPAVR